MHRQFDRDLAQQGHLAFIGQLAPATTAKNRVALLWLLGRCKPTHVLHHPQHGDPHLLEHRQAAASILQCNLLGRGHHDNAGHGYRLGQAQLGIASAWRQVHHQHIAFSPIHLIEELADDSVQHRAAPDHRLIGANQQAHRHHRQPTALNRCQPLTLTLAFHLGGAIGNAEHGGGIGPVDVRIE